MKFPKIEQKSIPKVLHHYCPMASFFGMIGSKTIRLANPLNSNDPNECRTGQNILQKIYKDKNTEPDVLSFLRDYYENHEGFQQMLFNRPFVFCLTEIDEDLNQWRIYGDNGYGVLLHLNTSFFISERLPQVLDPKFEHPKYEKLYFDQCIYDEDLQTSIVNFLLFLFSRIYKTENKIEKVSDSIVDFIMYFNFYSAFFKDQSYKAEHEWRYVIFPVPQQAHNVIKIKIEYSINNRIIQPYIEIPIDNSRDDRLFKKALIGSNSRNEPGELMNFTQNSGAHVSLIGRSKIQIHENRK